MKYKRAPIGKDRGNKLKEYGPYLALMYLASVTWEHWHGPLVGFPGNPGCPSLLNGSRLAFLHLLSFCASVSPWVAIFLFNKVISPIVCIGHLPKEADWYQRTHPDTLSICLCLDFLLLFFFFWCYKVCTCVQCLIFRMFKQAFLLGCRFTHFWLMVCMTQQGSPCCYSTVYLGTVVKRWMYAKHMLIHE